MNKSQQNRFDSLYQNHVKALMRQGKARATIDAYARAVRRIAVYFDRCPDRLTAEAQKRGPEKGPRKGDRFIIF